MGGGALRYALSARSALQWQSGHQHFSGWGAAAATEFSISVAAAHTQQYMDPRWRWDRRQLRQIV